MQMNSRLGGESEKRNDGGEPEREEILGGESVLSKDASLCESCLGASLSHGYGTVGNIGEIC